MKKYSKVIMSLWICFCLVGCAQQASPKVEDVPNEIADEKKILIAYFSRPGENSGVGVVEKGNTAFLAEAIGEATNGELFQIETKVAYPINYKETTDLAKQEQNEQARPELTEKLEDPESYDIVFLGYPIWWSDMPMAMYQFLEENDLQNAIILPFCTHAGGGISNSVTNLKAFYPYTLILDGFAMSGATAQKDAAETKRLVDEWLQSEEVVDYLK